MFGNRRSYTVCEGTMKLQFENGEGSITPFTDEIIHVFAPLQTQEHHSKAVDVKATGIHFEVTEKLDYLQILTKVLEVRVYDGFILDFYDRSGKLLCADYRGNRQFKAPISKRFLAFLEAEGHDVPHSVNHNYAVQVVKRMEGDESFYGLGDKTGFLNKKNYDYEMWNSDIPLAHTDAHKALYKSIPFFLTLRKECTYGIFFDNTYHSYFDMAKEKKDYYFFGADEGNLDYYFIGGEHMPQVITNYTWLTGRTPLPQLFALGYHQSRWGYESAAEVRAVAKKYRDLEIPIDTIHLDIDYMDGFRVFTWNEKDFEQPGQLIADLKKDGYKIVTIIDPGVKLEKGYAIYDEGLANDYFVKTPKGETYVNAVWPGDAVYPDFGNPKVRAWWAEKQKYLLDLGVRGVWNDMNEPASFRGELPLDVVFTDENQPSTHAAIHNVYGHLMAKATYEGLKKQDGRRPFVITRACYSGSQKYTTAWTGDNQSLWEHLQMAIPQMCNMGLSGLAFIGTDVGGFGADTTPELLSRWVQVGCFSPLFRNHSSKGSIRQEPWLFGEETLAINKKYIELRYQLLPYLYDLFWQCEKTGLAPIRPLVLHYEQEEETKNQNGEFLFGEQMLVAPVVEQGATHKMVYLPKGIWFDYWTGEKIDGGNYLIRKAPLDVCPIYIKSGSIIPNYKPMHYVGEQELDTLILDIYPGTGKYIHYQDNGENFDYQDGRYNQYEFVILADGTLKIELVHHGYEKLYRKIAIRYKGVTKEFAFEGKSLTIWM